MVATMIERRGVRDPNSVNVAQPARGAAPQTPLTTCIPCNGQVGVLVQIDDWFGIARHETHRCVSLLHMAMPQGLERLVHSYDMTSALL